jgi:hypothetical protein
LALIEIVQIDFEFNALLPLAHDYTPEAATPLNIGSKKTECTLQGTAGATAAFSFRLENERGSLKMQFLVYVTLLMVSISTVLLEVHWLASPEPRLNPTVQTRAVQTPKAEGSNAGIRTVYPDASRPLEADSQVQTTDTRQATDHTPATNTAAQPAPQTTITSPAHLPGPPPASTPQGSPSEQSMPAAPVSPQQPLAAPSTQSAAAPQPSAQQSRAETTGVALREENRSNSSNGADNSQQHQATLGSSGNRCDILACAGTYRSFRANDCTYQPFDGGARRLCEKSAGQRLVREGEQPNRRRWSRNAERRNADRVTVERRFVDNNDDAVDVDDFIREPTGFLDFIFLGRRSR